MAPPDAGENGITPEQPQDPRRLRAVEPAEAGPVPRSLELHSTTAPLIIQDGGTNVIGKRAAVETGTYLGEFPYVRFGHGPENLVILPGITLENEPPNRLAAWTYRLGFGRFARAYTVFVINRRRGMPLGYTTQDMAQDYARVIESELGPSHLMGFYTGAP